ncbi:MAG: polysaccharide biosynthesis protein [Bdellovibrionales bacterium]|nr:polysaccharide biosynthesis protein [Bdellovibrionales bacterium]
MFFIKKLRQANYQHVIPDALLIVLSLYISLFLRVGGTPEMERFLPILVSYLPIFLCVRLLTFVFTDVYLMMWRYVSTSDSVKLFKAVLLSSMFVLAIATLVPGLEVLPRSLFFIDSFVLTLLLMGARLSRRLLYEHRSNGSTKFENKTKTIIYGAGGTGRMLSQRYHSGAMPEIDLIGFIDDDPKKLGKVIAGSRVVGTREDLSKLLKESQVTQVIVAISVVSPDLLRKVFEITRPFNVIPKMASNESLVRDNHRGTIDIVREIEIGDLLQRPPRMMDLESVRELIKGKRVLVTGAGGSIGSEIARQVFSHEPSRLFLVDHSEFNLYQIDKELRLATHDVTRVAPLLIDIKDKSAVENAFKEYSPEIIFHAAAYKHVHLVEANPLSAILNNIMGTVHLLEASKLVKASTFVNISSDKAVNPAGVMGATKRVCEILTALSAKQTGLRYCSVRFGNVLGSSGSLIPILTEQIQSGKPLTITHKDMTRYFMLIPEAVQLVLKASTIARPGDINVLKMGEPVKILDLAHSLITLLGKSIKDVPIIFTGLRPGEKMFEELYIRGDELKTEHPDILTIPNGDLAPSLTSTEYKEISANIDKMISFSQAGNRESLILLSQLVRSNYIADKTEKDGEGSISNLVSFRNNN